MFHFFALHLVELRVSLLPPRSFQLQLEAAAAVPSHELVDAVCRALAVLLGQVGQKFLGHDALLKAKPEKAKLALRCLADAERA